VKSANTPALLRESSFKGAEALQSPLNQLLKDMQSRLTVLEQAQGVVLLGPRRIFLPVAGGTTPESAVDFQLPEGFTPRAVFLVSLEAADVGKMDVTITPAAITYEVTGSVVRVMRINTTIATGVALNLTLGAIRG
jgi:hypothetical protein